MSLGTHNYPVWCILQVPYFRREAASKRVSGTCDVVEEAKGREGNAPARADHPFPSPHGPPGSRGRNWAHPQHRALIRNWPGLCTNGTLKKDTEREQGGREHSRWEETEKDVATKGNTEKLIGSIIWIVLQCLQSGFTYILIFHLCSDLWKIRFPNCVF